MEVTMIRMSQVLEAGLSELLSSSDLEDDDYMPPTESSIGTLRKMMSDAVGDDECPEFHLSTIGDGGVRLHCGAKSGRQFILTISPDFDDGNPRPSYIYHDGDGLNGLDRDVDADELRRRLDWVARKV